MQTSANTRTKQLIAVGVVVALAVLSIQVYALANGGSPLTTGITKAHGTTDPQSNSTVTVTGAGQTTIQPNLAIITVGVTTQSSSAQSAAQDNANTMTSVIAALEKLGINSSSIQTVSYNVYQQQGYSTPPYPCKTPYNDTVCVNGYPVTYVVNNEIQVQISVANQNLSQLGVNVGAAIDAAVAAGANEVYGVQFTATGGVLAQANQQALQLAVKDAASKATTIASALGVTVTGVVSVTMSPSYSPYPINYDVAGTASQTPIAPQSLTITASVQAVYAIS